ncbi:MAG: hypothetical protein Q4G02_00220 [bacterium]|nr:hypothetical protein [bacterium]
MRYFEKLPERDVKLSFGLEGTIRELHIQDFDTILDLQNNHCIPREKELGQEDWSRQLNKNELMRILASGFILGAFEKSTGKLMGYAAFYHLDPEQPVSYYAKQLNGYDQALVAELKKPRVHPDFRGHQLSKALILRGIEIIKTRFTQIQALVVALPMADIYSPTKFAMMSFEGTNITARNRAGKERRVYLYRIQ